MRRGRGGKDWAPLAPSFADGPWSVCRSCVEMLNERAVSVRNKLCNRLPRMFGIDVEGWEPQWR